MPQWGAAAAPGSNGGGPPCGAQGTATPSGGAGTSAEAASSAEELLRQMVATKTAGLGRSQDDGPVDVEVPIPPPPDPAAAPALPALEQGHPDQVIASDGRGSAARSIPSGTNSQALGVPIVHPPALLEMTVDSSPEREKAPGRGCSISSSSSESSRGRRRSRSGKGKRKKRRGSSSSSGSSPRRKKRINNFSSIRNVEKERAKTRVQRSQGAAAAVKVLQTVHPLTAGPYFAP